MVIVIVLVSVIVSVGVWVTFRVTCGFAIVGSGFGLAVLCVT